MPYHNTPTTTNHQSKQYNITPQKRTPFPSHIQSLPLTYLDTHFQPTLQYTSFIIATLIAHPPPILHLPISTLVLRGPNQIYQYNTRMIVNLPTKCQIRVLSGWVPAIYTSTYWLLWG